MVLTCQSATEPYLKAKQHRRTGIHPFKTFGRKRSAYIGFQGLYLMANARKILIVDDDTDLRDTLVEQLSLHEEFEASAVDTGAKGATAAKVNAPDLVLMDVGLPDTDGREVVRSLRKGGFKAPIIMLTGHDTDSDTIAGPEPGAASPARSQRRRGVFGRPLQLPARLQDADRRQCQEGKADREGNRDPALPLSGRPIAGLARDAAAESLGL